MNQCTKYCLRLKSFSKFHSHINSCLGVGKFCGNFSYWTRPPDNANICRAKEVLSRLGYRAETLSDSNVNTTDDTKEKFGKFCDRAFPLHSKRDLKKENLNCDNQNLNVVNQITYKCDKGCALASGPDFGCVISSFCLLFRKPLGCCKGKKLHSKWKQSFSLSFSLTSHNKYQYLRKQTLCCHTQSTRCLHTSASFWSGQDDSVFERRLEPPWRVLFFGTDHISVETLQRLHENMNSSFSVVESLEVVCNIDKREVRNYAEEQGLRVYDWPIQAVPNKYDVGVLVSFGYLIPEDVIDMFPYGILNMHPSLLPRWRGASPIIHTILNGDPETGISIMEIRPKHFDIGPLLMHRRFPVPPRCTSLQLSKILAPIGADMIIESLADLRTLERFEEEQDKSGIRYAHKLVKKNANINWENQTCDEIDQQFRAISEVIPLRSQWRGQVVKLIEMIDPDITNKVDLDKIRGYEGDFMQAIPGTPAYHKKLDCVLIKCKDGVVGFKSLSVRKQMTANEFLGGYLTPPDGSIFESLENDLNRFVKEKRII